MVSDMIAEMMAAQERVANKVESQLPSIENLFVDMDLTVARFPEHHGEQGTKQYRLKPQFFQHVPPYDDVHLLNAHLMSVPYKTFILSNTPAEHCDYDKCVWLARYLPAICTMNYIFNRGFLHHGRPKPEVAMERLGRAFLTPHDVLVDDNRLICEAWEAAGGTAIQRMVRNRNQRLAGAYNGLQARSLKHLCELLAAA